MPKKKKKEGKKAREGGGEPKDVSTEGVKKSFEVPGASDKEILLKKE